MAKHSAVIPWDSPLQLNRYLYAKLGPEEDAPPAKHAAWNQYVLPRVIRMAQSPHRDEIRMLIEAACTDVDARIVPRPEVLVKPKDRDRKKDEHIGRLIPGKQHRRRRVSPRIEQMQTAMLVSTGVVDKLLPGQTVQQRVPLRQLAELMGISHQRVHQIIVAHGERGRRLVRVAPTRSNSGKGRIGLAAGLRRGAPAHPATLYQYTVTEQALQRAREYVEQHGYPQVLFPAELIDNPPPEMDKVNRKRAHVELRGIIRALTENGHSPERIRHLFSDLKPVGLTFPLGRPRLILRGWVHYRGLELIHSVWPHLLTVLLE